MRRRRAGASEMSSHPFRSMFDLMVALVFLLLAALVLRQGRRGASYDARPLDPELLLLHNAERRLTVSASLPLLGGLSHLDARDPCLALMRHGGFLTTPERDRLESHRVEMWARLAPRLKEQLLADRILRRYGQDLLRFASGSAVPINRERRLPILEEVYGYCRQGYRRIRVEGHTDDVPIHTVSFPSNWELSAARAIWLSKEIEAYLNARGIHAGQGGVLIEAIGYGERNWLVPNTSEANRRRNRRIEIVFER